jgi:hypothetical protein
MSQRTCNEKGPNKMIKLNQFRHDKMDFVTKQVAFEKLKFLKESTKFIFSQNWKKFTFLFICIFYVPSISG